MRNTYQNSYNFFKQKAYTQEKNHASLILAAYELKTPENMGAIIRLAANLNAEKVLFIHREFDINKSKIEKVAHSSQNKVDYQIISETLFTETIKDKSLIAIETTSNSCNIFKGNEYSCVRMG
ncbi:MAG: hypothetical protein B7C24_03545 [Bacteroidetes bacterium 4572_77]|nr:MAG: hypothetical protein B7C24_03545 [Bacteroidetes bacterium 4572_77]